MFVTWLLSLYFVSGEYFTLEYWGLGILNSPSSSAHRNLVSWLGGMTDLVFTICKMAGVLLILVGLSFFPQLGFMIQLLTLFLLFSTSFIRFGLFALLLVLCEYCTFHFFATNFPQRKVIWKPLIWIISISASIVMGMTVFRGDVLNPNRQLFDTELYWEDYLSSYFRDYFGLPL